MREFVAMATIEDAPMATEEVQPVVRALRPLSEWMAQCSKHLSHIEKRAMWQDPLGHEMMRQFAQLIEAFSPPPRGDWGWLLRRAEDMGTRGVRQLMKTYHQPFEGITSFLQRAMAVVRLFLEEAFHRCLLNDWSGMRKRALCSLMVTMRTFEAEMIPFKHAPLGIFYTLTPAAVMRMALRVNSDEDTSIEMCPSYEAAMKSEMRVEVVSLMLVRPVPNLIAMTQAEVRALIEHNDDELFEGEAVPGKDGVSAFDDLFDA